MNIQHTHKKAAWLVVLLGILSLPMVILAQSGANDIPRLPDGKPERHRQNREVSTFQS